MSIKLYNGDCLEVMKNIPDKSINLILCDLPYNISACAWDKMIPLEPLWELYNRIIKDNGVIVLFGGEPFSSKVRLSNLKMYKYDWKWEKPNGANFLNSHYQPLKVHEDIMVFSKSASTHSKNGSMVYNPQFEVGEPYVRIKENQAIKTGATIRKLNKFINIYNNGTRYPRSIIKFGLDKEKLHPTQKPIALLEYLIKTYSNEGDMVLDNCMGVGGGWCRFQTSKP